MNADQVLRELESAAKNPGGYVVNWRERHPGAKVLGCVHCMPNFVPEELVDAAGALPVGIWGWDRPVARAESLMQPFACSMARTTLELGLAGHLAILDGIVFSSCCDTLKNLGEIWKGQFPGMFAHTVLFPAQQTRAAAVDFLAGELALFRDRLSTLTGPLTDPALAASLTKYDAGRAALRELASARRQNPRKIRAREMAMVIQAASIMDRADSTPLLRALAAALPARADVVPDGRRVLLAGTLPLPLSVVDALEAAGALVVEDDLGMGRKFYELSPATGEHPMARLARTLLSHTPVSTIHRARDGRARHLLELARESGAEAIVFNATKFCEPEFFDHPDLKRELDAAGMPSLLLETELGAGGAALSTRIGAFIESLD